MSSELFYVIFDAASTIVGLGYPIWRSYKVVEAKKFDNELIQWLSFWVIVSCLYKIEDILSFCRINISSFFGYKVTRLLFIVWMIHPRYQGALFLYFDIIEYFFKRNEEKIRRHTSKILTVVPRHVKHVLNIIVTFLANKGKQKPKNVQSSLNKSHKHDLPQAQN